jgi:hypothetical protein
MSVAVFVLDGSESTWQWDSMAPDSRAATWDRARGLVVSESGGPLPSGSILLCHSIGLDALDAALRRALAGELVVIGVSGGTQASWREIVLGATTVPLAYQRKALLAAANDAPFAAGLRRFREHLERTGHIDWDLIEP